MFNNEELEDKLYGNNLNDRFRVNTRFNYDPCRTIKRLGESTGPGRYYLNVPGNGAAPPFVMDPLIITQRWSGNLMSNPVDIEASLKGINRPLSRDLIHKDDYHLYEAKNANKIDYPINNKNWTEQSRAIMPAWQLRGIEQSLWGFPLYNPQENICMPFLNNTNTRIIAKDYFDKRACPRMI